MKEKIIWLIKQLYPCEYFSIYEAAGKKYIHTWIMFLGKVYCQKKYEVKEVS